MFLKKGILKAPKVLRWSTLVPVVFYLLFISIILKYTVPLRKQVVTSSRFENNSNKLAPNHNGLPVEPERERFEAPKTVILADSIDANHVLRIAFNRANTNHDKYLSIQELARYINKRIMDHITNAIETNPINFAQIDKSPRDGLITWEEYHAFFLRERGMDENYILDHTENKHSNLNRKAKEEIMRDKAFWSEAARTDPFSLTLDEFLAFRHPESSAVNLLSLVDDLLRQFDMDGDDQLTVEEFSDLTVDDEDERYKKSIISKTVEERREEFKRLIDKNKDGKADRSELLTYVDPKHPRYALQEAATLVSLADTNKDKKLSLDEILNNSKLFMTSKMIDTSNSFHNEF